MSAEESKALVRRYVEEVVNRRNLDVLDEIFAADFVQYGGEPDQVSGVEALKQEKSPPTPPSGPPDAVTAERIAAVASEHGIEMLPPSEH